MVNVLHFRVSIIQQKLVKKLSVMSVLLFGSISICAQDFQIDGLYYNKLSNSTVEVTNQYGGITTSWSATYTEEVRIPSKVEYEGVEYDVVAIGSQAFASYIYLKSITIPENVTSIGKNAFNGCESLPSIILPDELTTIGEQAFFDCKKLTTIKLPSKVQTIEYGAFQKCINLSTVELNGDLQEIGIMAFDQCKSLTSIDIPKNIKKIGNQAFSLSGLTTFTFPSKDVEMGWNVFLECDSLTTFYLPDNLTKLWDYCFQGCTGLTSFIIPDGVTSIGKKAFNDCSNLTSITIPAGVSEIGEGAFSRCSKLTSILLPKGITSIADDLLRGCSGLTSINIPQGVTSIGDYAFSGCSGLKSLYCLSIEPPTCGSDVFYNVNTANCTLYVPLASLSQYSNADIWKDFTNIIALYETCEAPTITFDNDTKRLVFNCTTEGAECYYTITSEDFTASVKKANEVTMTGVYNITAYASANGMYNSEKATAKLCWVSAAVEGDGIMSAKSDRGIVLSSDGNQININGTVKGELIEVYNVGGVKVKAVCASGENTSISGLQSGNIYIVKIGGTKVKVAM